jgi:sacsin
VSVSISSEWNHRLGWDEVLLGPTLLSQLNHGIQRTDKQIIDAILTYISEKGIAESVADALLNLPCILSNKGVYVLPSQAFRPPDPAIRGCEGLAPYLVNVERRFWHDHQTLMRRLKVGDQPQVSDLLEVQSILEAKPDVEEPELAVAIEILNHASRFPREMLAGLKVISISREFYPLEDINFNDLGVLKPKETANLTHPEIPLGTIRKLGIGMLSEKLIKGMLEIEDQEDEFEQQESVTTRIADTLERYTVESTFREYLANADDAQGASQISWLLDQRTHPGDKLLTPELAQLQGPALLTYNDGSKSPRPFESVYSYSPVAFSENDFRGLKNVGEGSKACNKESIGQFGRGSQTMYHWTDVPMILSGEYLLILE